MADIQIAIRAKNEASAAINQTSADLAGLASSATATDVALGNISDIGKGLTGASASVKTASADYDNLATSATDAAASLNSIAVEPIDITATDGVSPVLDAVQGNLDAASFGVDPIDITAIDNATPILDSVVAKAGEVVTDIPPLVLEVDDGNWKQSLDDLQARLQDTKAQAADLKTQLDNTNAKPITLSARDNASPSIDKVKGALGGINNVAGTAATALGGVDAGMIAVAGAAGIAIGGVVALGKAVFDLGEAGASFGELRGASEALGASFGVNAKNMLFTMREAADGTISDSALMLAANRAVVTGVTKNAQTMATLIEEAKARADAFGLSSTEAFNTLVTGIGNAAPRMLKQLGYTIDLTTANEAYARSIGTTADALTEQQQRAAVLQAVLAQSGQIPGVDSAADNFEKLAVSIENVRNVLGLLLADDVAAWAQNVANALNLVVDASRKMDEGLAVSLDASVNLMADWKERKLGFEQKKAGSEFLAPLLGQENVQINQQAIDASNAQIAALQQLQNTVALVDQAYQQGVSGAGDYVSRLNAISTEAKANNGLSQEQVTKLQALNVEVQNAIRGLDGAAASEAGFSGAMSSASPAIDEQTGKLKALWIAASGALGASAAFDGYKKSVEEAGKATALNEQLGRTGIALPPVEFQQADALADAKKQIDDLTKAAQEPITLEFAVKGISDQAAQKAYADAIKAGQDSAGASQEAARAAATTTDEVNRQVAAWQEAGYSTNQIASFLLPSMRSQIANVNDGVSEMGKRFDDIKGKVSGLIEDAQKLPGFKASDLFNADQLKGLNLSGDSQVSIDQAANGGIQPDAINENAKRLMAIAKEGLGDQSWLEEFKKEVPGIFAELENSPDIRGSALRILQEFQNGMRPELLDKGLIKDRVKQMIIGDQNAAALANEIAQEIAGELGISLQQAMTATNSALGVGTGTGADGAAAGVTAPDLTATGTTTGASFAAGIVAGFTADGMTVAIVAKIDAEFSNPKNIDAIKKSGGTVGAVWGSGFLGTVGTNIPPGLYDVLVSGLVPLIIAALQGNGTRTGAQP